MAVSGNLAPLLFHHSPRCRYAILTQTPHAQICLAKVLIKFARKFWQELRERFLTLALLQLAFPYYMHLPAICDKRRFVLSIAFLVSVELCHPIFGVLLGKGKVAMRAAVPITSVLLEKSQLNI